MENAHLETFKAQAQGNKIPTKVSITGTEWTFQLDEPVEDGGTNSGANLMQYFAENNPRGGAKSCPTYRAAGQDVTTSDGLNHGALRQRNKPGPDLLQMPIREKGK